MNLFASCLVFFLSITPLTALCPGKQPTPVGPVVNLGYTTYVGTQLSNGVNQYLGVRYAAAPLGKLRWRAPIKPPQTNAVETATTFPPLCLGINEAYPTNGYSEDCLFANIWAPANATTASKLPVWVFIPGGGYNAISNGNWIGDEVVEKSGNNIVMINFNYRVGLFGFLASERVRQDGNLNVGMLDQRMLLLWIKQHISQFGGDPDHVVIHGASAGAGSVALHFVAYGGRNDNLFVGGIAESIFFPAQPFVSELEYQFDRVVLQTNCSTAAADQQMSCLRGLDASVLQKANIAQEFPGRTEPPLPLFYWTPAVDGDYLPDLPSTLYENGRFLKLPMLLGTTTDEGTIFVTNASTPADMTTFFGNNYPKLTPNDTDAILGLYPLQSKLPEHAVWFPSTQQAYGEATFICPAVNVLNAMETGVQDLFAYRYNVQDDENTAAGIGVLHVFEAAAVFGPDNIGGSRTSYKTYNAAIVPVVMNYWISFVRTLDPSTLRSAGAPTWDRWGSGTGFSRLLFETNNSRMETTPGDQLSRCQFWLGMGGTLEQKI
ncbi:alpha/beta-hydrolase [Thozetella sp. PMI_491]|nr:alpha/beta-hydrolase [Thozetella sp. PMI_491]